MGYIDLMYEVLAYVYETYWGGEDCPGREQLGRRLSSAGFERDEIMSALSWLDGLNAAAQSISNVALASALPDAPPPSSPAQNTRIFTPRELDQLGSEGISFLLFLEGAGALPMALRELVIERALAMPESPLELGELKVIVMMVYWRTGVTPDALILDELSDNPAERWEH